MEIYIQPTTYSVSAVPAHFKSASKWTLKVERLAEDRWVVSRLGDTLSSSGEWNFGHPTEDCYFELEEALEFARVAAPELTLNQWTVADALRNGPEWR